MGGETSKAKQTNTEIRIQLDRQCQQAGAAVRGKVMVVLGDAQRELFKRYDQGAEIALRLVGKEKVYWAAGHQHNPQNRKPIKHLIDGEARREFERILVN